MSQHNTVSIAQRVANQQVRVNMAADTADSLRISITVEEMRAERKGEEPRPDVMARLESELAAAETLLENLESVLIGLRAMRVAPPIRVAV